MTFAQALLPEFDQEMKTTRSLLERVPFDKYSWKPHSKSTGIGALATHLVGLAGFGKMIVEENGRDFAKSAPAFTAYDNLDALLSAFDANVAGSRAAIESLQDSALGDTWTLQAGERVIMALPRGVTIRTLLMNHMIHHRGQMSVYLRLNEVPLPSIYGPTADT